VGGGPIRASGRGGPWPGRGDASVVILGSYNWTLAGVYDNDENTLIIHDRVLAEALCRDGSAVDRDGTREPMPALHNVFAAGGAEGAASAVTARRAFYYLSTM
jgi:hypothetical protein